MQIWGDAIQKANTNGRRPDQPSQNDEQELIYTVSAAVRIPNISKTETRHYMPFFSCPRVYTDESQMGDGKPHYVQERFEESDLLPIYSVALGSSSVQEAFDVIIGAHRPQDTSLGVLSESAFNESKKLL